jgi:diphthamide biosynthesis protein 3
MDGMECPIRSNWLVAINFLLQATLQPPLVTKPTTRRRRHPLCYIPHEVQTQQYFPTKGIHQVFPFGRLSCIISRVSLPSKINMPLYEEIEIEDMSFDPVTQMYSYPCPCGDRFKISLEDLWDGEDVADCQSCTLFIQVIYEEENLPELREDDSDDDEETTAGTQETLDNSKDADTVTDAFANLSIEAK